MKHKIPSLPDSLRTVETEGDWTTYHFAPGECVSTPALASNWGERVNLGFRIWIDESGDLKTELIDPADMHNKPSPYIRTETTTSERFKEQKMETTIKVTDKTITVTAKTEDGDKATFARKFDPAGQGVGHSLKDILSYLSADLGRFY